MAWKDKHGRPELIMHPDIIPVIGAAALRSVPVDDEAIVDPSRVSGGSDSVTTTENAQGVREGAAADHPNW